MPFTVIPLSLWLYIYTVCNLLCFLRVLILSVFIARKVLLTLAPGKSLMGICHCEIKVKTWLLTCLGPPVCCDTLESE